MSDCVGSNKFNINDKVIKEFIDSQIYQVQREGGKSEFNRDDIKCLLKVFLENQY